MSGRYALLIGNSHFDDPALARLSAPEADVAALRAVLEHPDIAGFRTVLLLDEGMDIVRSAVAEHFSDRYRDDVVLLYYSGHGLRDDRGDLYFALPRTMARSPDSISLGAGFVRRQMDNSHSMRQVLVLDCCHSGAFMRPGTRRSSVSPNLRRDDFDPNGHGRFILAAAAENESAFEENGRSIFTRHLVAALEGAAAVPGRDGITIHDVHEYVRQQVGNHRLPMGPRLWVDDQTEPLVIARSPCPSIAPVPEVAEPRRETLARRFGRLLALRRIKITITITLFALAGLFLAPEDDAAPPEPRQETEVATPEALPAPPNAPAASGTTTVEPVPDENEGFRTNEAAGEREQPVTPAVPAGPSRGDIRLVQGELRRLGLYRGAIDGLWGRGSRGALSAFLSAEGFGGGPTAQRGVELLPQLRAAAPARQPVTSRTQPTQPYTGCRVRVIHPLWALHEAPSNSSATIGSAPRATYTVQSQRRVSWAGVYDWWFRITVDGRTGWIRASAPFVEAAGEGCFR